MFRLNTPFYLAEIFKYINRNASETIHLKLENFPFNLSIPQKTDGWIDGWIDRWNG